MKSLILSLFAFSLFMSPALTHAEVANCFDYYKFQSVQVSVGPDQPVLQAGEPAVFRGELVNQNDYPVVDGYVFVRIGQRNPDYQTQGQWIVDEFFAGKQISLSAGERKSFSFTWTPPQNLPAQNYRADYFFSVGKKFNLGGLPFTNEIVVGSADFSVDSDVTSSIIFDKANTTINGQKYNHIGTWPSVSAGDPAVSTQVLKNNTEVFKDVSIKYDLFFWDSLNESDKLSSQSEKVSLDGKSSKTLSYTIPKVDTSVYYLRITATTADGQKSIVNIRVSSEQERPRLNYPAVDKFPLKAGDDFNLFACFHNTSDVNTNGEVKVVLTDESGEIVGTLDYKGVITSAMGAERVSLKASRDLAFLKLDAGVYDKDGKKVDEYTTVYSTRPVDKSEGDMYILWAILVVAILLLILTGKVVNKRGVKITISTLLVIISILALATLLFRFTLSTEAETVSADGKVKTESQGKTVYIGYLKAVWELIGTATVTAKNTVTLSGNTSLSLGDAVSFTHDKEVFFDFTGGNFDTPYAGYNKVGSTPDGGMYRVTFLDQNPTVSLSSSNTSVMTCSGMNCTAVGPGTATVTVNVSGITSKALINANGVEWNYWYCNYASDVSLYLLKSTDMSTGFSTSLCHTGTGRSIGMYDTLTSPMYFDKNYKTLNFNNYSPTWTFTVTAPTLTASCTVSPSTTTTGQNVTWTASASGGTGSYTYSWSGDDGLSGTSQSVTKSYSSYGTKHGQVTVTSGGSSVTSSNCSNSIAGGGSTGVSVSSSTINGVCDTVKDQCVSGTFQDVEDSTNYYLWSCNGQNGGTNASCSLAKPTTTGTFDCSLSGADEEDAQGRVAINNNTTWTLNVNSPISSGYTRHWAFSDGTMISNNSNTVSKIFTTLGSKSLSISFSSSTESYTCDDDTPATTSVVLPGSLNEI